MVRRAYCTSLSLQTDCRTSRFHQAVLTEWVGTTLWVFFLVLVSFKVFKDLQRFPFTPRITLPNLLALFAHTEPSPHVISQAFMSGGDVIRYV